MFYSTVYTCTIGIFINVKVTIKDWKPIMTVPSKAVSSDADYWSADFDLNQNCKQKERIAALQAKVRQKVVSGNLESSTPGLCRHFRQLDQPVLIRNCESSPRIAELGLSHFYHLGERRAGQKCSLPNV